MKRSSGVLMHLSSLPSPYGIGTLGRSAYAFADFLAKSGQSYWQMLPLGPTSFGDSPYQSASAFAGNPYFIDLDLLIEDGLLDRDAVHALDWGRDASRTDYALLFQNRRAVLYEAYRRGWARDADAVRAFRSEQASWLEGYALYAAVKEHFGQKPFIEWDEDIRLRAGDAVARYGEMLQDAVDFYVYVQYLFFKQWGALSAYIHKKGLSVIGDLPIYVPYDSADVWENPSLFQLDESLKPRGVAGVPPDYFSADGQLWGNPLYDWTHMAEDGYAWWIERLRAASALFDVIRLDHFRGFDTYWDVPFGDDTARNGQWRQGPGMAFLRAAKSALPDLEIIAEDLGILSPSVRKLLSDSGFPGMRVLEFGLEGMDGASRDLPHNYPVRSIAYIGTHDNMTAMQWMHETAPNCVGFAVDYLNLTEREGLNWGMMRGLFASPSVLAIVQMQDILGLDEEARMNTPASLGNNWQWRMTEADFAAVDRDRLRYYTMLYGRLR